MRNLHLFVLLLASAFIFTSCGKEEDNSSSKSLTDKLKDQGITFQVQKYDNSGYQYMASNDVLSVACVQKSKASDFRRLELLQTYRTQIQNADRLKLAGRYYYTQSVLQAVDQAMYMLNVQLQQMGFNTQSTGVCPQNLIGQVQLQRY